MEPGNQYQYFGTAESIAKSIQGEMLKKEPLEEISDRVRKWVGYGERYELLAKDLGGLGILYILPNYSSESL